MNFTRKTLFELIDSLNLKDREKLVLKNRIEGVNLSKIGEKIRESDSMVRLIEWKACMKLKWWFSKLVHPLYL
jgi:DNA-directed RNA polymerase specialized sigma subunit